MKNLKMYQMWTILLFILKLSHLSLASECFDGCACTLKKGKVHVNCSNLNLEKVPKFGTNPVDALDLSGNQLREFPVELSTIKTLVTLDLSNNLIQRLDSGSLQNFTSLENLSLSNNLISNWMDIHPNKVLVPATNLYTLSLTGNPISDVPRNNEAAILISKTLKVLNLKNCSIARNVTLLGLSNLEELILNDNPLEDIIQISSKSLQILSLSNCDLNTLHPTFFDNLPSVTSLDLSKNLRLSFELEGEFARSDSLRRIDLSYCNLDKANLYGFPKLKIVIFKRNMIRKLTHDSFEFNTLIEYLDLSNNAISVLDETSLKRLRNLTYLDLSFNTIPRLDRDTFKYNEILTVLNLSKNPLSKFDKIDAKSILSLNMSWCEITSIDSNSLSGMPEITTLDLSHNFIDEFPEDMNSRNLQKLHLNGNRLSFVTNSTFCNFPNLLQLNLKKNQFSTIINMDDFKSNPKCRIWLQENPWCCDCSNSHIMEFIKNLQIADRSSLRCTSPVEYYNMTLTAAFNIILNPSHSLTEQNIGINSVLKLIFGLSCFGYVIFMCIRCAMRPRHG